MAEWIKVSERLPEKEGWYLVYTNNRNKDHRNINKAEWFYFSYFNKWHWRGSGGTWTNVTHWMPLPEPPEAE